MLSVSLIATMELYFYGLRVPEIGYSNMRSSFVIPEMSVGALKGTRCRYTH